MTDKRDFAFDKALGDFNLGIEMLERRLKHDPDYAMPTAEHAADMWKEEIQAALRLAKAVQSGEVVVCDPELIVQQRGKMSDYVGYEPINDIWDYLERKEK